MATQSLSAATPAATIHRYRLPDADREAIIGVLHTTRQIPKSALKKIERQRQKFIRSNGFQFGDKK